MKTGKVCMLLICLVTNAFIANTFAAENAVKIGLTPEEKSPGIWSSNHFNKDWSVMLGVKIWPNKWDLPVELYGHNLKTYILEFESGAELTYIPAFLVRYRNFFIGGSYLLDTDYDFVNQKKKNYRTSEEYGLIVSQDTVSVSGSRKEWDINIGYFILPNLAVSIGYKNLDRDLDISIMGDDYYVEYDELVEDVTGDAEYPLSAYAPIIGVSASAPLISRLNIYGNLAYGLIDGDATYDYGEKNELDLKGEYVFSELGLSYGMSLNNDWVSAMNFTIGYRFQRLEIKMESDGGGWGNSGDQHDSTAGLIIGASGSL